MFNLEESIAAWRNQMLAAGINSPVPLDELESHLREDIERQTQAGMNTQQAFEIAVQQIGVANMLQNEFQKADETKRQTRFVIYSTLLTLGAVLMLFGVGFRLFGLAFMASANIFSARPQAGHWRYYRVLLLFAVGALQMNASIHSDSRLAFTLKGQPLWCVFIATIWLVTIVDEFNQWRRNRKQPSILRD